MEGISHLRSLMGTGECFLRRWRPADTLQRTPPTLKIQKEAKTHFFLIDMHQTCSEPAVIQTPLPTFDDMKTEIAWRTANIQEKLWEVIEGIEWIKDRYGMHNRPSTPLDFDPLRTTGKYL
jgi:hypothetical protein